MRWLILILLVNATVAAQELDAAWEAGRYQDILEAIDARVAATGEVDAALLHDRGNCLFRLGRFAEAALAYRRSLLRAGPDPETAFNLQLSERRLGLVREEPGLGQRLLDRFRALDDFSALILILLLESGALVCLVLGRRRPVLVLSAAVLLVLVVAGAWRLRDEARARPGDEGVVLRDGLALRMEPRASAEGTIELKPGELVVVEARSDRWLRVRCGETPGYVLREGVGLVD